MAAAVIPMFRLAGLPLRIDLVGMAGVYWWATGARAAFVAILLAVLCLPWERGLGPIMEHYRRQKLRLPFLGLLTLWLVYLFGWSLGLMLVVDAIAVAELLDRAPELVAKRMLDVLIPAGYLFAGLILVFALNHAIAAWEFAGSWDGFFNRLDARIFGLTVSEAAHWSRIHLPEWLWQLAGLAYYNVFAQVGAVLAIIALASGRREALRYVGVILTAYGFALVLFYFMPTMGPFALHRWGAQGGGIYPTQATIPLRARLLWQHAAIPEILQVNIGDYYIGLPSMHVVMPAVALWFLRRWRRIAAMLLAFDVFIVMGIILFEWHYFLDIFAGVGVAAIAIALNPASRVES